MSVYKRTMLAFAIALWGAAVASGMWMLWQYDNTPARSGAAPKDWPAGVAIERSRGRATLIMAVHPLCPCSRASLSELAVLMTQAQGRVNAHVLVYKPASAPDGWAKTGLWSHAAAIPGVSVRLDEDGVESRRFGAEASGQTLLYDQKGSLLFRGGITASRGHAGDNAGRAAIVSLLLTGSAARRETFVFGCALAGPDPDDTRNARLR